VIGLRVVSKVGGLIKGVWMVEVDVCVVGSGRVGNVLGDVGRKEREENREKC
jgi:hypothetical protein